MLNEVGHVIVTDTNTNTLIETIPVGTLSFNLDFDTLYKMLYVGNLDDETVSVIDTNTNTDRWVRFCNRSTGWNNL